MGYGTDMKKKFAEQKASEAALTRLTAKVHGNGKANGKAKANGQGH